MKPVPDLLCQGEDFLSGVGDEGQFRAMFGVLAYLFEVCQDRLIGQAMHAGLMHSVTRTALAVHAPDGEAASDDAWISTALLRPILNSAVK